jgi:hypothetical protein
VRVLTSSRAIGMSYRTKFRVFSWEAFNGINAGLGRSVILRDEDIMRAMGLSPQGMAACPRVLRQEFMSAG